MQDRVPATARLISQSLWQIEGHNLCQIECPSDRMPDCQTISQNLCQIDCKYLCQIERQNVCQKECDLTNPNRSPSICQNLLQIECHIECQEFMPDRDERHFFCQIECQNRIVQIECTK